MRGHGQGANGKSTYIELLARLLGDYTKWVATEMLMQHQRSPQGPSTDIVGLKGRWLVYCNEVEEGRHLAEARVKELTGETISISFSILAITMIVREKLVKAMIDKACPSTNLDSAHKIGQQKYEHSNATIITTNA